MGIRGDLRRASSLAIGACALCFALFAAPAEAVVTYTPRAPVAVGADPKDLVVLPRAGSFDLATANFGAGADPSTISVIRGPGLSTVNQTLATGAGEKVRAVTAADFNGDGDLDLVAGGTKAFFYEGDGAGGFGAPVPTTLAASTITDVAAMRYDADASLDLVVGLQSTTAEIYKGNGDGTFAATPMAQDTVNGGNRLALGNFAGTASSTLEMAATNEGLGRLSILGRNGSGVLEEVTPSSDFDLGGVSLLRPAVGDLNGDGKLDTAVPSFGAMFPDATGLRIKVLLGDGAGGGTVAPVPASIGISHASAIAIDDLDSDGFADLAVTDQVLQGRVVPLLGGGNGSTYTVNPNLPAAGNEPVDIVADDFTADGNPDLAAVNEKGATVSILDARAPTLVRSRTRLDVGAVEVGEAGSGSVSLSNAAGANPRLLPQVSLTGPDAAEFSIASNACAGARLVPGGAACQIGIGFEPTTAGPKSATLGIASNAGDSPQSIALAGTAVDCSTQQAAVESAEAAVETAAAARAKAFQGAKKAKKKVKKAKKKVKKAKARGDSKAAAKAKKKVKKAKSRARKAKQRLASARTAEDAARSALAAAQTDLERCLAGPARH